MAAASRLLLQRLGRLLRPLIGWHWLGEAGTLVSCWPVTCVKCATCCAFAGWSVSSTCSQRQQQCHTLQTLGDELAFIMSHKR